MRETQEPFLAFFEADKFSESYTARTEYLSTIVSLFGPAEHFTKKHAQWYRLLYRWRDLVDVLHDARFDRVDTFDSQFFAKNCRPSMAVFSDRSVKRSYKCRLYPCPWCWSRHAGHMFRKVEHAMPFELVKGDCFRAEGTLVLTRRLITMPIKEKGKPLHREASILELRRNIQKYRKQLIQKVDCRGATQVAALSVTDHDPDSEGYSIGHCGNWESSLRTLFWVETGSPELPNETDRYDNPSKRDVTAAVSRLFRYPRSLLDLNKSQAMALNLMLHSQGRVRLRATYGDFRVPLPQEESIGQSEETAEAT